MIGRFAFETCKQLTEITLPEGVESIGADAFIECTNLKRIVLPASLTKIDKTAFMQTHTSQDLIDATYVVVEGSYAENFCQSYKLKIEYAR